MVRRVLQGAAVTAVLALLGVLVWDLVHGSGSKIPSEVASNNIVPQSGSRKINASVRPMKAAGKARPRPNVGMNR